MLVTACSSQLESSLEPVKHVEMAIYHHHELEYPELAYYG